MNKMLEEEVLSKLKSSSVLVAVTYQSKTVPNTEKTLLSSNANSVAVLLNGFVGEILTSASLVIRSSVMEIM